MAKTKSRTAEKRSKPGNANQSVDEFMTSGFDNESNYGEVSPPINKKQKKVEIESDDSQSDIDFESESDEKNEEEGTEEEEGDSDFDAKQLEQSMKRLQSKDPDFYKYLAENDSKLLDFEVSDDDSDKSDKEEDPFHKPDEKLKVASDDSDYSEDEEAVRSASSKGKIRVTSSLLSSWTEKLDKSPDVETIRCVIKAFHSALEQASDSKTTSSVYIVEGNNAFNGIVRLCLVGLIPGIHKVLKIPPPTMPKSDKHSTNPSKSKQWPKILVPLKTYLTDVVKMMSVVSESEIVTLLLRHILYLIPFFMQFLKHARILLKKLVNFWCTSEETIRVLSFLGIIRLSRLMPKEYLDYILKQMYMAYVKNCKFTSPSTWPMINFMKRSLVELYCLDYSVAYQQAFVYVRQLAIHLRNALATKNKDALQTVYNWQYIHCVLLWSHLLSQSQKSDIMKPLIYPLVQIALGTIRLIPTAKYFPLRFQLISSLTKLSEETGTFIPLLPLVLEVLNSINTGKKHMSLSMKPLNFTCVLKVSKSQQRESGFNDACIQHVFELFMDYAHVYSHTVGFPELVLPAIIQIKIFSKKCKVANYCKEMKQLIEKLDENSTFITNKRKSITFSLSDIEQICEWEGKCKENVTPLEKFYISWRKTKNESVLRSIVSNNNADIDEFEKLKTVKPVKKMPRTANIEEREELKELFVRDESDGDENSLFGE